MSSDILKFPIYVKPPQSGKTQDAIIRPMEESFSQGRIPVIIIPSRIQLQKQITKRLLGEFKKQDNTNIEKIINMTSLSSNKIGRFDTGNVGNRLSGSIEALRKISDGSIKTFVVLNNKAGMTKLLCTMVQSDKKFDIIVDEIHGFFNISLGDLDVEELKFMTDTKFWKVLEFARNRKKLLNDRKIKLENTERIFTLFEIIKKCGHKFSGCTATVSYVAQSLFVKMLNLDPRVIQLDIPECYYGYERVIKESYEGSYKVAIGFILEDTVQTGESTTVMCHVNRKQQAHKEAAFYWIDTCLEKGIDKLRILAMIDNGDGYRFYDHRKNTLLIEKINVSEPWRIVNTLKCKGYDVIGIFGDHCMSESNTYQKCSDDVNCPINHLIVVPFNHSLAKMTVMIQKIGRIFGNDTRGEAKRTIWFPECEGESYQTKIEKGLSLDYHIQKESTLRRVNFKRAVKLAKSGRLDRYGNIVEQNNEEHINYEDLEDRFRNYLTANTKIAKFVRSLDNTLEIYTKEYIIDLLSKAGYNQPQSMFISITTNNGYGSMQFFETNNYSSYLLIPEIKAIHKKVFTS